MRSSNWRRTAAGTLLAAVVVLVWAAPIQADPEPAVTGASMDKEPSARNSGEGPKRSLHHHKRKGLEAGLIDLIRRLEQDREAAGEKGSVGPDGDAPSGGDGPSDDGQTSGNRPRGMPTGSAPNTASSTSAATGNAQTLATQWNKHRHRHHHHHHRFHRGEGLGGGLEALALRLLVAAERHARGGVEGKKTGAGHAHKGGLSGVGRRVGKRIAGRDAERIVRRAEHAAEAGKHRRDNHPGKTGGSTASKKPGSVVTVGGTKSSHAKGPSVHPTPAKKPGKQAGGTTATAHFKPGSQVKFHGSGGKGQTGSSAGRKK